LRASLEEEMERERRRRYKLFAIQRVLSNEQPLSVGKSTAHNWHNNYVSAQVTSEYMSKKTATEIVTAISRTTTKSANSSCAAHCNTTVKKTIFIHKIGGSIKRHL